MAVCRRRQRRRKWEAVIADGVLVVGDVWRLTGGVVGSRDQRSAVLTIFPRGLTWATCAAVDPASLPPLFQKVEGRASTGEAEDRPGIIVLMFQSCDRGSTSLLAGSASGAAGPLAMARMLALAANLDSTADNYARFSFDRETPSSKSLSQLSLSSSVSWRASCGNDAGNGLAGENTGCARLPDWRRSCSKVEVPVKAAGEGPAG